MITQITDKEVELFRHLIESEAGIDISGDSRVLLIQRLSARISKLGFQSFTDYHRYLLTLEARQSGEYTHFIDKLTTNETYFFREDKLLNKFSELVRKHQMMDAKIWSMACSSGEECYTLGILLDDIFQGSGQWKILGTDISSKMITSAKNGVYADKRMTFVPEAIKDRYFQSEGHQGQLLRVSPKITRNVFFHQHNLLKALDIANTSMDIIFCRNVLIYFNDQRRRLVLDHALAKLKPGGYLFIGLSENIRDLNLAGLLQLSPSVFQKAHGLGVKHA